MLRFVPDHLTTKKMCNHAVKILPYLIRYIPGCVIVILKNGGTLNYVPDYYKNPEICD